MTDYPLVRFVSDMTTTATTRFDFHDPGATSTDRATWVWTPGGLLGEPDSINPDYGLGRLDFQFQVHTSHADAMRKMAALGRELRRGRNFLLFQFDQFSPPGWLEVYPSSPGALGFPYVQPDSDDNVWIIPVSLTTGPTIIGEQVSHTLTIGNDPATGGLCAVLPEIEGDAPAPLVVEIAAGSPGTLGYPLISALAVDEAWPGLTFWQAESGTMGFDAAVEASASSSGGSRVLVDFDLTPDMARRLYLTVTPPMAGRFRVFARVKATSCTATIRGGSYFAEPVTTTIDSGDVRLVDLGIMALPYRNMPTRKPYTLGPLTVDVDARRDSGSGTLAIDYLVAIPVDLPIDQAAPPRLMEWDIEDSAPDVSLTRIIDGEHECVTLLDGTAHYAGSSGAGGSALGGFLRGVPGATNVLHFLPRERTGGAWVDDITETVVLTVTYRRRHIWLPGS